MSAKESVKQGPFKHDANGWLRLGINSVKERPLGETYLLESEVREHWDCVIDILGQTRHERDSLSTRLAAMEKREKELALTIRKARIELLGIGHESSKDFHRIGIDSAVSILESALQGAPNGAALAQARGEQS